MMNTDFSYSRRPAWSVQIGNVTIGSDHPIALQSMTNTSTLDTEASAAQIIRIADAGADIVRLTAQGVAHARNLGNIHRTVRSQGCNVPLVADIHFNPAAAFAAAEEVEKVRINPGNFVDPGRTFKKLEYTDEEYASEILKIEDKLVPLLDLCKKNDVALRIGVNHGSLSDRIMSRYGDTPAGMVESAMEFLRVCLKHDFHRVVISIKASNVVVMTETVRRLVAAMDAEDMHFPLHLGVTEAGDGEDGRIKSAVGIGSLLADGIGDTIRVSLSEAPENEIPVARKIVDIISHIAAEPPVGEIELSNVEEVSSSDMVNTVNNLAAGVDFPFGSVSNGFTMVDANLLTHARATLSRLNAPSILRISFPKDTDFEDIMLESAVKLGSLLLAGAGNGIYIDAPGLSSSQVTDLELGILQATRRRFSKTEYIACPGCGRTLFDLQKALASVRAATSHLSGLKIAVMGCIVNGPGEMADADYGYVGAAAGNVSLYKGKECVVKNIPTADALPLLIKLIKDNGDWTDAKE